MRGEKIERDQDKEGFRGSRHLSKAVSTPPGASETAQEKRGGFPRLPATLKSRLDAPPGPPKRLQRSEKVLRSSRQLSKAASTSRRGRRNDSGEARRVSAVAGNSQKPPHSPRLRGGVFPSPPFCQLSPRVILADHHTYRVLKEVNALKAVADREVI